MDFLKKLFRKEQKNANSLKTPIKEIKEERESYVNVGQSIFPIIKASNDPKIKLAESSNPLIKEELSDEIVLCFLLDLGNKFELISQNHLKQFGLTQKDIKDVADRNLRLKANENCKIGTIDLSETDSRTKPFYRIEMDNNLNPSMLLIDEFWDNVAQNILKSKSIAVNIPAKNLIFFSDLKVMESFRTMIPVADQMYQSSIPDGIELSKNTYIRKNGKWIKFLDTAEQMAELWQAE